MEFEPLTQIIYQTSENGSLRLIVSSDFCFRENYALFRLWDSRNLTLICEYPPKPYALLHCDICSTSTSCLTSSAGSENYGCELSVLILLFKNDSIFSFESYIGKSLIYAYNSYGIFDNVSCYVSITDTREAFVAPSSSTSNRM